MSVNKSQILSNLGQEFAKQALTTQTAQGTAETNWPLIIGVGAIVCCCCLSCSGLLGYLIYAANKDTKEPFDDDYQNYGTSSISDGSSELRTLIILVLLGLLVLYLLTR
jgi:hypothetical protein